MEVREYKIILSQYRRAGNEAEMAVVYKTQTSRFQSVLEWRLRKRSLNLTSVVVVAAAAPPMLHSNLSSMNS